MRAGPSRCGDGSAGGGSSDNAAALWSSKLTRRVAWLAIATAWASRAAEAQVVQRHADVSTVIAERGATIYSVGDLILVNPQQSSVILLSVIALSTAFEYVLEVLMAVRNRYHRAIILAVKEATVSIGVAHMLLLGAAFSLELTRHWQTVLQSVAMILLYMAFTYIATTVGITLLVARSMARWRRFEWASLVSVSRHGKEEQLFSMSRQAYLAMLPFEVPEADPSLANAGDDGAAAMDVDNPNAQLLFSSVLTVIERRHLKSLTDFTPVTWIGFALLVTINGFRAVTVVSLGLSEDATRIAQSISFIVTGYLMTLAIILFRSLLFRRHYGILFRRAAENGGSISAARRTDAQREDDVKGFKRVLFFSSVEHTMQIFKVFWLGLIWYSALLIVGIFYVLWRDFRWWSLLLYALSIVPPILCVLWLPSALVYAVMCAALGAEFEPRTAQQVLAGELDVNDHDVRDVEDEDGSGWAGIASSGIDDEAEQELERAVARAMNATRRDAMEEPVLPDEVDGGISFREAHSEALGAPARVIGVRPVLNEAGSWRTRSRRPVFDDTAGLRRDAAASL